MRNSKALFSDQHAMFSIRGRCARFVHAASIFSSALYCIAISALLMFILRFCSGVSSIKQQRNDSGQTPKRSAITHFSAATDDSPSCSSIYKIFQLVLENSFKNVSMASKSMSSVLYLSKNIGLKHSCSCSNSPDAKLSVSQMMLS